MSVHEFFKKDSVDLKGLSQYFDRINPQTRMQEARSLSAREQAMLFEAAKGFRPVKLVDFVPENVPPLKQVIHYGRNSLPLFRIFEKRFCRPEGKKDELWGYNEQPMKTFTGPGFFVAWQVSEDEVLLDYTKIPPGKPREWPEILPNSARLSRFIYYNTQDYMRGVSRHVSIGRATRKGKPMDNWFVLCREEL